MSRGDRASRSAASRWRRAGRACPLPALLAALLLAALASVSGARADGDPASDFLLEQSTFLSPFDGHVASAEANRLIQMLAEAQKDGFALKVAVIVTPYDLGAVPILFGKPQTYATFLGEEDYYYWKDELLVVMPAGYGIYKSSGLPAADKAVIAGLGFTHTTAGTALVAAAERAVRALAARRGITLGAVSAKPAASSTGEERIEIGAVVLAAVLIGGAVRFGGRRRRSP
jgi:hypothetical protein